MFILKLTTIRWEDGNNLTSNLLTLITPLTTHKNTSDMHVCSYKFYTEKKQREKKIILKKMRKKNREKINKTVRYVH